MKVIYKVLICIAGIFIAQSIDNYSFPIWMVGYVTGVVVGLVDVLEE